MTSARPGRVIERGALLVGAGAASLLGVPDTARAVVSALRVSVAGGTIAGIAEDSVEAFRGIPYGEPTSGSARYRVLRPAAPWKGIFDASRYGPNAPQGTTEVPVDFQAILNNHEIAMPGEDCFRLNVWTPQAARTRRRPVMVWFNGGGFSNGSDGITGSTSHLSSTIWRGRSDGPERPQHRRHWRIG